MVPDNDTFLSPFDSTKPEELRAFVDQVWSFYRSHKREMPWRTDTSPYYVLVSELMLQQTQVSRVMEKFPPFIEQFSDIATLAGARFQDVLAAWSGLGYNRRARFLHQAAKRIVEVFSGVVPDDPELLVSMPGIGPNTAGSIAAFAYNRPVIFIETNIRRVFIYAFFQGAEEKIHDREILPLLDATLSRENPREWYWALMDLGVVLARTGQNPNRRSVHYTRQSAFEGSDRQLRGRIIRLLNQRGTICAEELPEYTGFSAGRIDGVLEALEGDGLVSRITDGDEADRIILSE